jgi:hypothetical protein
MLRVTSQREVDQPAGQDAGMVDAPSDGGERTRREVVEIVEAVLLSVVTIVTAWAGYSAAAWSTQSRLELAHASTLRVESNQALGVAESTRNLDLSAFNTWYIAYTLGNKSQMAVAERRFRPDFRIAFDAWIASDPVHNPHAPPGPTFMPQYHQPQLVRAATLSRQADQASAQGDHNAKVADNYVRISVVLASVLFLVGMGSTFRIKQVRWVLTGVGMLVFVGAAILLALQPVP